VGSRGGIAESQNCPSPRSWLPTGMSGVASSMNIMANSPTTKPSSSVKYNTTSDFDESAVVPEGESSDEGGGLRRRSSVFDGEPLDPKPQEENAHTFSRHGQRMHRQKIVKEIVAKGTTDQSNFIVR
jgi:hypothetical protein